MGADNSFYVKIVETHARAFFKVIIFSLSSVNVQEDAKGYKSLNWTSHEKSLQLLEL